MRRIMTSIAVLALTLSLLVQAAPAQAVVAGYDSAYSGESAFLSLARGQTGSFTVFFANTGSTTWMLGSTSQVDLAACRDDKVSCNAQDSDEAAFDNGWRSSTRYAAHTQTAVSPGQIGTFTYSVRTPSDAAPGTYRFNGALVISATGQDVRNEGYFQDVTVAVATSAATITELDPEEGSIEGGDTVIVSGSGFECSPEPQVLFDDAAGDVFSCGPTSLSVETPEHAAGTVDVTVVNSGASASNSLEFEFLDDVRPTLQSITAEGRTVTLQFSEPVCTDNGTLTADTELRARVDGVDVTETGISFAECDEDEFSAIATFTITEDVDEGDEVSVTITTTGADEILDQSDQAMDLGETETAIAGADETEPTLETATASDEQTLEVVFSEPVTCDEDDTDQFVFDPDESGEDDVEADDYDCDGSDTVTVTFNTGTFAGGAAGVLEYNAGTDPITDGSGNEAPDADERIVPNVADRPTIEEASVTVSEGFQNTADAGDEVTLVFSEDMNTTTSGDIIRVMDGDGTIADLTCGTLVANNSKLEVTCDYDQETLTMDLLEDAIGETITTGDTVGLQWPATVIDSSNVKDEELEDVDLDASADTEIE